MKRVLMLFPCILITTLFSSVSLAQVCTKRALPIKRDIPELNFNCGGEMRGMDWAAVRQKDLAWTEAVSNYERALEKWAREEWWNVAVQELNACKVLGKEGKISGDQNNDYLLQAWQLQGEGDIRVLTIVDPCLKSGTATFPIDAFVIARRGGDVFAKLVINGKYSASEYQPISVKITKGNYPVIELSIQSGGNSPRITTEKYKASWSSRTFVLTTDDLKQPPFTGIQKIVCAGVEAYPLRRGNNVGPCTENDFIIHSADLNSDGQSEWFYFSPLCGALGNCGFYLFQKKGLQWKMIGSGSAQYVGMTKTSHAGYADLRLSEHDNACVSYRALFVWNGRVYKRDTLVECNYCNKDHSKKEDSLLPKACRWNSDTITIFES